MFSENIQQDAVCLLGGSEDQTGRVYSGNVYVGVGGSSKPVCDDSWDATDGQVVCRQLGFFGLVIVFICWQLLHRIPLIHLTSMLLWSQVRVTLEGVFGRVAGGGSDFAMDNTVCNGSETKLTDCRHVSSDDCGPNEVAGVVCDQRTQEVIDAETRMVDECFETGVSYHHGKYLDFDIVTSAIACQQHCRNHQDCRFFTFYDSTHKCYRKRGSSKRLRAGAVSGPRNCSDNSSLPHPLTPPDNSYRIVLKGGSAPHEGNVFVGPEDSEKPVCDDNWTLINADVACKQLGWAGALTMTKESRFGATSPDFAMDQVRCDGTEERLVDCRHTKQDDCGAGEAAGAICDTRSEEELAEEQSNCFHIGIGYNAGEWIDFDIVASALDCQTHCRGHSECRFFTYYSDTGKC